MERRKITRVGAYSLVFDRNCILVIQQIKGPYAGKFDFPGGAIEQGETPELALRREMAEEVAIEVGLPELVDTYTTQIDVPATSLHEAYTLLQTGILYRVTDPQWLPNQGELQHLWIDPKTLSENQCSNLLWMYIQSCQR